jgi:hypothetical protein
MTWSRRRQPRESAAVPDRFSHALSAYEFNPDCPCEVCANGGTPKPGPSSGHSFAYDQPHMPPPRQRPMIGKGTFIHPTAHIAHGVTIGRDCRVGPGASIGWDGFGWSLTLTAATNASRRRIRW